MLTVRLLTSMSARQGALQTLSAVHHVHCLTGVLCSSQQHPGTPCIFYDHFVDGSLGEVVRKLLSVRRRFGINARSKVPGIVSVVLSLVEFKPHMLLFATEHLAFACSGGRAASDGRRVRCMHRLQDLHQGGHAAIAVCSLPSIPCRPLFPTMRCFILS